MTFTLLQMLNEKANKFTNLQTKIAVVNKLLGSCEDRTACHDPVREIIADFHSIVVVVVVVVVAVIVCTVVLI